MVAPTEYYAVANKKRPHQGYASMRSFMVRETGLALPAGRSGGEGKPATGSLSYTRPSSPVSLLIQNKKLQELKPLKLFMVRETGLVTLRAIASR